MAVHNGASMVIARRSYGFKERVPKLLKDKLIEYKESFNKKNEWAKWAIINKIITKEGVNNPGLWQNKRKQILGLVN